MTMSRKNLKESGNESIKVKGKKVNLNPPFKNPNILCGPDAVQQAVTQTWAVVIKCSLTVGFCPNIRYD